jgi:hypothetical protein
MAYCDVNHWKVPDFKMPTTEDLITIGVMIAAGAIVAWMAWLEKHPPKTLTPRLLPTTLIMLVAGLVALMALFHLVDLFKPVVGP